MGAILALAGCGDDEEAPDGISLEDGVAIEMGAQRDSVDLGVDPVLTAGPNARASGGCDYYPLSDQPLTAAWEICFNAEDEIVGSHPQYAAPPSKDETLAEVDDREPPEDASASREALIARGDGLCWMDYENLEVITEFVDESLRTFGRAPTDANAEDIDFSFRLFVENIDSTREQLSAFDAPEDGKESLDSYLEALATQADVLDQAREELLDLKFGAYTELGDEFTSVGKGAQLQASNYGFSVCSAPDFG